MKDDRERRRWLTPEVVVIGYAAVTGLACYLLVRWRGPDNLLAALLLPVLYAAVYYPRRVPYIMLGTVALGGIWTTYYISSRFESSLQTITTMTVVMAAVIAVIQRVTSRQQETEQARLRYAQRLQVLRDIDRAVLVASSPDSVARAALDYIHQLIPCAWSSVALVDFTTHTYRRLATVERGGKYLPEGDVISMTPSASFTSLEQRRAFLVSDLALLPNRTPVEEYLLEKGTRSLITMPTVSNQHTIGSLNLGASEPNFFTQEHIEIAQEVADQLAIALAQAQLRERLAQTNEQLRDALRTKDDMIANVSHELRTPLTHIIGYADLLQAGALGSLTAEQRHAINVMDRQGQALNHLVDVLLSLQTLADKEDLEWEAVSLAQLAEGTVSLWKRSEPATAVTVAVTADPDTPPVWGDMLRLQQALEHLLDNALKFTGEGGTVTVRVRAVGDEVWLAVADTGIGIPRDRIGKIFQRFYQVEESTTRRHGGMGLGLALVQQIVLLHGGRIWVESDGVPGRGATFTIALPAHRVKDEDEKAEGEA